MQATPRPISGMDFLTRLEEPAMEIATMSILFPYKADTTDPVFERRTLQIACVVHAVCACLVLYRCGYLH